MKKVLYVNGIQYKKLSYRREAVQCVVLLSIFVSC